jgi:hypothetical protein
MRRGENKTGVGSCVRLMNTDPLTNEETARVRERNARKQVESEGIKSGTLVSCGGGGASFVRRFPGFARSSFWIE